MIFFVVIGGIMQGWFSPTEAGSIGTAAVLNIGVCQEGIPLRDGW